MAANGHVIATPVLDTSAYADGDVMNAPLEVKGLVTERVAAILVSMAVLDKSDQGIAFEVHFFASQPTVQAPNAAWAVTDAEMAKWLGMYTVAAADFTDLGGNRIATYRGINLGLAAAVGSSIWIVLRSRGAGTYAADGIQLRLGTIRG